MRANESDKALAIFNFSAEPRRVRLREALAHGQYTEFFSQRALTVDAATSIDLEPWGYAVLTAEPDTEVLR